MKQKKGATIRLSVNDLMVMIKNVWLNSRLIKKAKSKGIGADLKLFKTQLSKQGGFLGALLGGLVASVLPQLLGDIFGKRVV